MYLNSKVQTINKTNIIHNIRTTNSKQNFNKTPIEIIHYETFGDNLIFEIQCMEVDMLTSISMIHQFRPMVVIFHCSNFNLKEV